MMLHFKRLYVFSIRSFVGPLVVTFFISMFILIMQFFWLYIDDLMGKGIGVAIILELLFYVSASLIPLALPLAILLSSIMTFGNLSENNELTALKSSGLSLFRIMRPLMIVVFLIAIGTFYFANFIIPVANLKWRSIIYDIQNTKIAAILSPGVYTKELDGYAIKVEEVDNDKFSNIIIHDHTNSNEIKTIRAASGRMYKSENGKFVFFELHNGNVLEELTAQTPFYDEKNQLLATNSNDHPARRTSFKTSIYKIDLSGFSINRSEEELFKNEYEMLNVFQLKKAKDSLQMKADNTTNRFVQTLETSHLFFQARNLSKTNDTLLGENKAYPSRLIKWEELKRLEKQNAIQHTQSDLRKKIEIVNSHKTLLGVLEQNTRSFDIETHRKFSLTYAIIVLFFIGAPLGAIIRKGGFGAPVVIAALLFMVYFILISLGESLALENVISPFLGMWFASIVLTPLAYFLMRAAVNDSPLFVMDNWTQFVQKFKKKEKNEGSVSQP